LNEIEIDDEKNNEKEIQEEIDGKNLILPKTIFNINNYDRLKR
jgi:hypothetical protein